MLLRRSWVPIECERGLFIIYGFYMMGQEKVWLVPKCISPLDCWYLYKHCKNASDLAKVTLLLIIRLSSWTSIALQTRRLCQSHGEESEFIYRKILPHACSSSSPTGNHVCRPRLSAIWKQLRAVGLSNTVFVVRVPLNSLSSSHLWTAFSFLTDLVKD